MWPGRLVYDRLREKAQYFPSGSIKPVRLPGLWRNVTRYFNHFFCVILLGNLIPPWLRNKSLIWKMKCGINFKLLVFVIILYIHVPNFTIDWFLLQIILLLLMCQNLQKRLVEIGFLKLLLFVNSFLGSMWSVLSSNPTTFCQLGKWCIMNDFDHQLLVLLIKNHFKDRESTQLRTWSHRSCYPPIWTLYN